MKSKLLSVLLIMSAPVYVHASGREYAQIPYPPKTEPSAPPSYNSILNQPTLLTGESIRQINRQTHAHAEFALLMKKIYQDNTIKELIKKQYPALSADQLLEAVRHEKEAKMDADGKLLLKRHLPEKSDATLTQEAKTLKEQFFAEQKYKDGRPPYFFYSCCFYKNACHKPYADKWAFDEPYCSSCTIQ